MPATCLSLNSLSGGLREGPIGGGAMGMGGMGGGMGGMRSVKARAIELRVGPWQVSSRVGQPAGAVAEAIDLHSHPVEHRHVEIGQRRLRWASERAGRS